MDAEDDDACTALHLAVLGDKAECVAALLAAGANFEHASKTGETALHLAASHDFPEIATQLLDTNANIEAVGPVCAPVFRIVSRSLSLLLRLHPIITTGALKVMCSCGCCLGDDGGSGDDDGGRVHRGDGGGGHRGSDYGGDCHGVWQRGDAVVTIDVMYHAITDRYTSR